MRLTQSERVPAIVGVPKEVRGGERRVILLPRTVRLLVDRGWHVVVERGAGHGIGIDDLAYEEAGARVSDAEAVWTSSDIVLKYKAPVPDEFRFFRPGLVLAGILHAEGDPELTKALLDSRVTAYSYEFFQTEDGGFPLAVAGGRIAGRMAALYGIWLLQSHHGGVGKLPGLTGEGVEPVRCVVIGSGNVGASATDVLRALGCHVTLLTSGVAGLDKARARFGVDQDDLWIDINAPEVLADCVARADLVIGAILVSTFDTPPMMTEEMVRSMRPGAVLVDATAGYGGGYMPSFDRLSELPSPSFVKHGVVHCKIDNYPAAVPTTAVQLVNDIYTPYLMALLDSLRSGEEEPISRRGMVTHAGQIRHPEVLRHARYQELAG
ncbi:hypothetical protein CUJ89_29450 [Burkholderia pyrrocinia]|uniref:Uncharacterized protein n=1 Tax=Burkholderia pyrrocinia TaxID=60550 RepID=A0A2Z5N6D5_BURPY|nr:hypothetical protein [Burkholderia pyrrocinia]AXF24424.1 hypothetical protein CUJ89_29450 [Burkholderia pyrrocinia]